MLREPVEQTTAVVGRRLWPTVAAATLLLFATRALLSLIRSGPVLVADEMGYLGNARALVGGVDAQMQLAPFYRGGYSLLIAPLLELSSSPTTQYHLVLLLNAALAASVLPLLYLLLSRFAGVPPRVALWASLAGAVYPAVTALSQVAMSENALFPLVCVWLICFAGLLESDARRSQLLWAIALGGATGGLWLVHNRMIVAVVIAVVGMGWLAYRRRIGPAALVAGLVTIACFFVGTHFLDSFVTDHNYGGSAPDELTSRMDELLRFVGIRTALANLLGQTWYLLVATFGLAAVVLGNLLSRRNDDEESPPDLSRPIVAALLALTGLLLLISASAFPERTRPDMLIYGRYVEVVSPALIAFGVAALARARAPRAVVWPLAGFAALTALVVLIRVTASDPDPANRWNITALPFVTMQLGAAVLIGAAVVALIGAALLRSASSRSLGALGLVALALFGAVVLYSAWNPVRSSERAVYPGGWSSPQAAAEASGADRIAYDLDNYETVGLYVFQWFLPDQRIVLFHGDREAPPAPLVIAGRGFGRQHPGTGAEAIWSPGGRDQLLWRLRDRQAQ